MDLQIEKQLFQGNQAALGSPIWRSILFFILDLQMENQLFQGNKAALGFYSGDPFP